MKFFVLTVSIALVACAADPCDVADWSSWTEWSSCSVTCGNGQKIRNREDARDEHIQRCTDEALVSETTHCNSDVVCPAEPINCEWAQWSSWTLCSTTCGDGHRVRTRAQGVEAQNGGTPCAGDPTERDHCCDDPQDDFHCERFGQGQERTHVQCPQDCVVGNWTVWSACSLTCGGGKQDRTRAVIHEAEGGGKPCTEEEYTQFEERDCNINPCGCSVSEWMEWSSCSQTCGAGNQHREREVISQPDAGGAACPILRETNPCQGPTCAPSDCRMEAWSPWSQCSASCGGGEKIRTRQVIEAPANGGATCGELFQKEVCNEEDCPTAVPTPEPTPQPTPQPTPAPTTTTTTTTTDPWPMYEWCWKKEDCLRGITTTKHAQQGNSDSDSDGHKLKRGAWWIWLLVVLLVLLCCCCAGLAIFIFAGQGSGKKRSRAVVAQDSDSDDYPATATYSTAPTYQTTSVAPLRYETARTFQTGSVVTAPLL